MESEKQKLSDILRNIIRKHTEARVGVRALAHDLHQQGMPLLMAIFAIPVCIPVPYPPGVSTVVACCISIFAIQLFMQRKELWLPRWFASLTLSRKVMDAVIEKVLPRIMKSEHLFKPRWERLVDSRAQKMIAVVALFMNIIIALPVPGIHFFPGWAIIFMCLGLLGRDGKIVAIGLGIAIWGVAFGWGEIYLGGKAFNALIAHWSS